MPELPEVEHASRVARRAARGEVIVGVEVLHPAQRRTLPPRTAASLLGDGILRVTRRGKYQLLHLASGRTLVVHFRLSGDWEVVPAANALPRYSRIAFHLTNDRILALVDPRALSAVQLVEAGDPLLPELGPEATARAFSAQHLSDALGRRSGAIKVLLLDQAIVAGVGNIYASEALWFARIDPRRLGRALSMEECARVVDGVKRVMRKALATPARYYQAGVDHLRFNVYDREGAPCRRCGDPIRRIPQGGRSTYWCSTCQR
jgi:formamidopyrimidine-DNA glycosylase